MKYFAYCRKSSEGDDRQALSIPAQTDEIKRTFADRPEIEIVAWLEEKMSAKAPGRPVYQLMIQRIEAGEADGIVSWHPDRLARNSVDGGWLIHLLDRDVLKDLKFVSYTFEKNPQGIFMLQIMFGQSKYYVDALSVNVKRGIRKKVEMGWRPNKPPLGYRNDRETNTIVRDPLLFPLVQRMWDMLLSGGYSVTQIRLMANEQWGFRTPLTKRGGGKCLSRASVYKMFANPFYAGILVWNGEWHTGRHEPIVTSEQYDRAREILNGPRHIKPVVRTFAYTGLIRCSCGLAITAEEKNKPSGRRYVYYHCTRRAEPRCAEPAVRAEVIDDAVATFLSEIILSDGEADLIASVIMDNKQEAAAREEIERESLLGTLDRTRQALRTLTDMRLRNLLDDSEYLERKRELQADLSGLERSAAKGDDSASRRLELEEMTILFRRYAAKWFSEGSSIDKRLVLQTICSNPILSDGKLRLYPAIPFDLSCNPAYRPCQWGVVDAIGTLQAKRSVGRNVIDYITTLKERAESRTAGRLLLADERHFATRGRASWRLRQLGDAA